METIAACGASFSSISSNCVVRYGPYRRDLGVGSRPVLSTLWIQTGNRSRHIASRASMQPSVSGISEAPFAPLRLESPVGQFLSHILATHPHLLAAAVENQLEQLQSDREADKEKEKPSASYRGIAEVKAKERKRALEEILYALVAQKFVEGNVSMLPAIVPSSADSSARADVWPGQNDKLEPLHSPEAYEIIQEHLSLTFGYRLRLRNTNSIIQVNRLRVGQIYADSVKFGYFLKRIDQRFQLEKSTFPEDFDNGECKKRRPYANGIGKSPSLSCYIVSLSNYILSFDKKTRKRFATIRSKEANGIIKKRAKALVGSKSNEFINISFGGLRRLFLEAVTFGSFLWDVESYVDSRYRFASK